MIHRSLPVGLEHFQPGAGKERISTATLISEQIRDLDESPLYGYRKENGYSPVIGEGDLHAELMIVGEAPGAQEAKTGRPFVGRAGNFLDDLLHYIGVKREDVYITNVVKDRPPENRKPSTKELAVYAPFLSRHIKIIRLAVVVCMGKVAMEHLFEKFDLPGRDQSLS